MIGKYEVNVKRVSEEIELFVFKNEYVEEITNFVANIYYNKKHYNFNCSEKELIEEMSTQEKIYSRNTITLCMVRDNEILCTASLIKRDIDIPFEKEFNLDIDFFNKGKNNIYEFARFASNSKVGFRKIEMLFKYFYENVLNSNDLLFASIDSRVYRSLKKLKYPLYKLGQSTEYMGSLTIPVGIMVDELPFLE